MSRFALLLQLCFCVPECQRMHQGDADIALTDGMLEIVLMV